MNYLIMTKHVDAVDGIPSVDAVDGIPSVVEDEVGHTRLKRRRKIEVD
jgi:hypothetical protein